MTGQRVPERAVPRRSAVRPVSRPHDPQEREADRAAEVVVGGGSVAGWSFGAVPLTATSTVQRQEATTPKSEDEKYKEAALKAGEAALATKEGKALKEQVLADPLVKTVTDAVSTTPGKVAAGAAIVGGVGALAATGKPLPFQAPAIPLDRITPGLSAKVTVEGPLNAPTFVGLTLTFREQGPKTKAKPDSIAADTARLRAQQEMFRPKSEKDAAKKAEQEMIDAWVRTQLPGLKSGVTLPLPLPTAPVEEKPVQRAPAPTSPSAAQPRHAHVDDAFASPGRPLDRSTRRSMEARFGYDFSRVRIHDDARAASTAEGIDADAFTVDEHVALRPGRSGRSAEHLLAHELAHVVQQTGGIGRRSQAQPRPIDPSDRTPDADEIDGRPLPPTTRRDLEARFGRPLDDVRLHTGPEGRRVAEASSAIAVSKGSDIFLAAGGYLPGTETGDSVLRHEIAHLIQARGYGIGPAWPAPLLEAEAELAALTPTGRIAVLGRAAPGMPLLMKTFVSTIGGAGYLDMAVKFYALWENEAAIRIGSHQEVVNNLASETTPLSQFRIVAHGNALNLFLPLLQQGKNYAGVPALGLQTQERLASELGAKGHLSADMTATVVGWISKDDAAKPLLARLKLTGAPGGMLREFLWWVVDEHLAANAKEPAQGAGTQTTPAEQKGLQDDVATAQAATRDLAAAGLSATGRTDLGELRTRALAAFVKQGWTWPVGRGELKAKLTALREPDTAALLREVSAGTFEKNLKAVKARVTKDTHIEIRGCNVGQSDDYLNGIREFFGTKPDRLPSISAPTLFQFYGNPGALVVPPGNKAHPLATTLKFLFEETFDDQSTAKAVNRAVGRAGLDSVGGLAKVLQFADIRTQFDTWWKMKRTAAGVAPADLKDATLQDFQDFLRTAPPRTFPVNAPGVGTTSLWFLILVPATAIPAMLAWVKDQGYSLPAGADPVKTFAGGDTKWDPARFTKAMTTIVVDWLGDPYPVPTTIHFPEDPEYKSHFRRLP
jgi:hypothetical protein